MVTQKRLKELLYYHPESGDFVRLEKHGRHTHIGEQVGTLNQAGGYLRVKLDKKRYYIHVLAWFYVTGNWAPAKVDHKDLIKHHNWFTNLRAASAAENAWNRKPAKGNRSGFKNIFWNKKLSKFQVHVRAQGVSHYGGVHTTLEMALVARDQLLVQNHGNFARVA